MRRLALAMCVLIATISLASASCSVLPQPNVPKLDFFAARLPPERSGAVR